jgi:hypothetical protein
LDSKVFDIIHARCNHEVYTPLYLVRYYCAVIYVLFQYCILLKDRGTSPSTITKTDFVSKPIGTGVFLQGATSKRDSMWHNPVFTCIRANRIPVNRVNRSGFRNFQMQVDLSSHCANRPLHSIEFVMGHVSGVVQSTASSMNNAGIIRK